MRIYLALLEILITFVESIIFLKFLVIGYRSFFKLNSHLLIVWPNMLELIPFITVSTSGNSGI